MPDTYPETITLGTHEYKLDDSDGPAHEMRAVPKQPGDKEKTFTKTVWNIGRGWGFNKYTEEGTYDYGDVAILHKRLAYLPGTTYVSMAPATAPNGPTAFCEYWDGTDANRRLICISPRYIHEVSPSNVISATVDMGATFTATRAMTKGVRFKNEAMTIPHIFIARQSATAADYMVVRTANTPTYAATAANKHADVIGVGKDSAGFDVLWRVDELGKINSLVADADPAIAGSWSGSTYPIGDISVRPNDVFQQAKRMLVGRPDGIFSFDNVARSIPLTRGMEQTKDARNCYNFKDWNGMALVATIAGIVWVDGLEWGYCGPISANKHARSFRTHREVAVTAQAGDYVYSATYDGTDSFIWQATVRVEGESGSGSGPFVWHGPVCKIASKEITDLHVSTVVGTRLWVGFRNDFGFCPLNADFSPTPNASSAYIYLPEGIFDDAGPEVMKEFHAVELVAPAAVPFSVNNTWGLEMDFGSGWESPGNATSGTYSRQAFTTEKTARRVKARLACSANGGSAELESVTVSGLARPTHRWHHFFKILATHPQHRPGMKSELFEHPLTAEETLRTMQDAGWQAFVRWGQASIDARVIGVTETIASGGAVRNSGEIRRFTVEVCEVP